MTPGDPAKSERRNIGSMVAQIAQTTGGPDLLDEAAERVENLGPDFAADAARLRDLCERLAEGRMHLAVLGQFKRGKSTLLNAFLGEPLLPTAVVPLTSIPTFLSYGPQPRARVFFAGGRGSEEFADPSPERVCAFLEKYVTEARNPQNRLGVERVEVGHPAAILREGVVLIDTPGIGSTLRHNTEATLNFLPQCDAALFLLSPDPPITEVEVEFLRRVRRRVRRLFFILNKSDLLDPGDLDGVADFIRGVLRDQAGFESEPTLFFASARRGLEARRRGDPALWKESGLERIESHLVEFLAREKTAVLREAVAAKSRDILSDVAMQLRLTIRSLRLPAEKLEEKRRLFEKSLEETENQKKVAKDLLAGDRRRMVELLENEADRLRSRAREYLADVMEKALDETPSKGASRADSEAVQNAVAEAVPALFERELGAVTRRFEERLAEVFDVHRRRADDLIEGVRRAAADLFEIPFRPVPLSPTFEAVRQPYWVSRQWETALGRLPEGLVVSILPPSLRRKHFRAHLERAMGSLVVQNVENLRWATLQNLDRTFHRFSNALEARLVETLKATRGAIERAVAKRRETAEAVADEIERLEKALVEIVEIEQRIAERSG